MTVKRISLRGISRSPSDRMSSDGGCAESINVHLNSQELQPIVPPVDITEREGLPTGDLPVDGQPVVGVYDMLYIHQSGNYQNYICEVSRDGEFGMTVELGVFKDGNFKAFLTLNPGEEVKKVTSLGNTVGVVTDRDIYWALYKEGEYRLIGTSVPFPDFHFVNVEFPDAEEDASDELPIRMTGFSRSTETGGVTDGFDFWALEDSYEGNTNVEEGVTNRELNPDGQYYFKVSASYNTRKALERVVGLISETLATNRERGYFNNQIMAVLALKLYDGTRIISTPALIAAGFEFPYKIDYTQSVYKEIEYEYAPEGNIYRENSGHRTNVQVFMLAAYKLFLQLDVDADFFADWEDIVEAIEVYVSQRAVYDHYDKLKGRLYPYDRQVSDYGEPVGPDLDPLKYGTYGTWVTEQGVLEFGSKSFSYEEEYTNLSNFYFVQSFDLSERSMRELTGGVIIHPEGMSELNWLDESLLVQQPRLDTLSDMLHLNVQFTDATPFNNKLLTSGISQVLRVRVPALTAVNYNRPEIGEKYQTKTSVEVPEDSLEIFFEMNFHVRGADGQEYILKTQTPDAFLRYGYNMTEAGNSVVGKAYAFLICPDPRAYLVDIHMLVRDERGGGRIESVAKGRFEMKRHPRLNCSYVYVVGQPNWGDVLLDLDNEFVPGTDSVIESMPNKLYVSQMDNPFVYPIESRYTFSSAVIGVAIATAALSPGQQGQFPVYVFTADGIWVMETNSAGDFLSSKPLNRHVAISNRLLLPLDDAVLFHTKEGVMIIQGAQVTNISEYMKGRHWFLTIGKELIIRSEDWREFLPILEDDTPFTDFLETAYAAYDYANRRILFFNTVDSFLYLYYIESASWHKQMLSEGTVVRALNSYPECFLVMKDIAGVRKLFDFSVVNSYGADNQTNITNKIKAVIATRPFDLEEPDVLKSISDLRIRGNYDVASRPVSYILLGSNDNGHSWARLNSLRGQSWKLFRLIILAKLNPDDRISWVDINYKSRFTNKLR